MNNPLFDLDTYDDDISYKELFEEVLFLRERVLQLEGSNNNLQITLDETQLLKIQLENTILTQTKHDKSNQSKSKRTYKRKELSKEMQMINSYYLENKNNEEIINTIKLKMNEIGYVISKKNELPVQIVKMECLKRYNELSKEEQERYKNQDISNKQ
jgi:transcription antitermination factor NusG